MVPLCWPFPWLHTGEGEKYKPIQRCFSLPSLPAALSLCSQHPGLAVACSPLLTQRQQQPAAACCEQRYRSFQCIAAYPTSTEQGDENLWGESGRKGMQRICCQSILRFIDDATAGEMIHCFQAVQQLTFQFSWRQVQAIKHGFKRSKTVTKLQ